MDISPYYIDARNAITQPDKMVFLSQYFRRRWMPVLGPLGTAIVIYLRGACYHNRKSGETRDTIQISQREIALGCGSSVPTIKRELERNDALRRFVQISAEWERDGTSGRVRQLENHYKVAMDDPLTEADEARLQEMVQERASQEQQDRPKPGERPRKPIRLKAPDSQMGTIESKTDLTACSKVGLASVRAASRNEGSNAVNTACSKKVKDSQGTDQMANQAPVAQNELLRPGAHFESTPIQNELLSEESLLKTTKEQTLNVRAGVNFVDNTPEQPARVQAPKVTHASKLRNAADESLNGQAASLVAELRDWGSERRHKQLLSICEEHGLSHLPSQALQATRQRLSREPKRGILEKPGAYYQRILIRLLEGHQVFVPTAGEEDATEVKRLARMSLGLEPNQPGS